MRPAQRSVLAGLAACLVAAALAACGPTGGQDDGEVTLRVFAAASLTEPFEELAETYEEQHPGTRVELHLGPSSGLARQVADGAPADVFASASPEEMDGLVQAGEAEDPEDFATNSMQIAVPPANPAGISALADLAEPGVKVAVCQDQVPCGKAAAAVFAAAGLSVRAVTEEVDVRAVLTKVSLGEVDAGIVYASDVVSGSGRVTGIEIAPGQNVATTYPVATLTRSAHEARAQAFVDLVLSPDGARVLARSGFRGRG